MRLLKSLVLTGLAGLCLAAPLCAKPAPSANQFAFDLFKRLPAKGNLFFSPFSIDSALQMVQLGARGETASQISTVLHLGVTGDSLGPLTTELNRPSKDFKLSVANRLWAQKTYALLPAYLETVRREFAAQPEVLDFARAAEPARLTINAWVETSTQGKIKDLLGPGTVTPDTRLVLTNAIYFKGSWTSAFHKEATHKAAFYAPAGERKIDFMEQQSDFFYFANPKVQVLKLPYQGDRVAMVVVLPTDKQGLPEVEKDLQLDAWLSKMEQGKVSVTFPKFKATQSFSLKPVLESLGMKLAFQEGADFSGINGRRDLRISAVVHKAFVEVDEKGTEAAAATGVVFMKTTCARPAKSVRFVADHPFLYAIRDEKSGVILFLGRMETP